MSDFNTTTGCTSQPGLLGSSQPACDPDFAKLAQQGLSISPRSDALGALGYFDVSSEGHTEPLNRAQISELAREVEKLGMLPPQWNRSDAKAHQKDAPTTPPAGPPPEKTEYHPGVAHNHQPSGRWDDFQSTVKWDPWQVALICKLADPPGVLSGAATHKLMDKKIAKEHFEWYFKGKGADLNENENIKTMMQSDSGVQDLIKKMLPKDQKTGTFTGHVEVTQHDYKDQDFRNAFGAIDRLDFKVDYDKKTIKVWFQDRYEWHPVGPGFYDKQPDDVMRPTNCVHAAAVEMKSKGAADYWMKGEATLPLSVLDSTAKRKDNFAEENPVSGMPWVRDKTGL